MSEPAMTQDVEIDAVPEVPSGPDAQGYLWACAEAPVPARSWTTLGVLEFPEGGAEDALLVAGAVGAQERDDLHLWCPSVHAGWLPLTEFSAKVGAIRFAGSHAVWARNVSDRDFDQVIVRVRYQPGSAPPMHGPDATAAYYASQVWKRTTYRGIPVLKHPCDLWVMQEILHDVRPSLVVETGTFMGGSALYLHDVLAAIHGARTDVLSIDVEARDLPEPEEICYLVGSSTSKEILAQVRSWVAREREIGGSVLVVLDSDHSYEHVLAELRAYAPLVSEGCYLVCEDTNTPGPFHAVQDFLASPEGAAFVADRGREKFGSSFNKGGWLYRPERNAK